MALEIRRLTGPALAAAIPDVAGLRISVFRAFPYLYDGDRAYEESYLARYAESPDAVLVGAYDGTRLVGASTGMPIAAHSDAFAAAFDGFAWSAFCSVIRPADHPDRPAGYRPLDAFWRSRGYAPLPGVIASFGWKDIGETEESLKPLQFWARRL